MQFKAYLTRQNLSITEVAEAWGMHRVTLNRVAAGKRWPSPEIMLRAHKLTRGEVGIIDWAIGCKDLLTDMGVPPDVIEGVVKNGAKTSGGQKGKRHAEA